jgi:predicted MFS family arabinose efflux permease
MNTQTLTGIGAAAPAIAMLGMLACVGGGLYLIATKRDRKKGVLLLIMSVVLLGNVLVWTL